MFTVCPKCALTLVVSAADLRVAQGYVRCGRCSSVFNALAQLSDDRQATAGSSSPAAAAPAPEPRPPPPAPERRPPPPAPIGASAQTQPPARAPHEPTPPAPAADDEDAIAEDALEFDASRTDLNSVFVEPAPDPQWSAATGSFKAMRASHPEVRATGDAQAAAAPARPEAVASPAADGPVEVEIDSAFLAGIVRGGQPKAGTPGPTASRSPVTAPAAAVHAVSPARPRAPVTEAARTTERPDESASEAAEAAAEAMLPAPHPLARLFARLPARESAPWTIGAAALLVGLAAQVVNHSRDALATRARLNRPLTALYAALGVPLRPHWDLHAYDVRQLGASVNPGGGEITVRASIRNGGSQPQPLPLLRVTLEDRFGTPLASRDVAPRDYLPGAVPASSFLSADQRIDAQMAFVDPGTSAVGFEIDACLPSGGGAVACANDPGNR